MTDSELQRKILDELQWEPSVNPAHIGVSVKDGIVTLGGYVVSYAEKYWAEQAAKRVYGVKAIVDELEIKLPGSDQRTDEDIAAAALNALRSHHHLPAETIKVSVRQGWVELDGQVEWQYQRDAAENAVRFLVGVKGVSNLIAVHPKTSMIDPMNVKAKIADAFRRSAELDAQRVKVDVQGSKVILRGRVRSLAERQEAERVVWSAPSVVEVDNKIVVKQFSPAWSTFARTAAVLVLVLLLLAIPGLLLRNSRGAPSSDAPSARRGQPDHAARAEPRDGHIKSVHDNAPNQRMRTLESHVKKTTP